MDVSAVEVELSVALVSCSFIKKKWVGGKEQETDLTCSFDPLLQEFHCNIKLWCIKWQRCIITPWGGQ